MYLGKFIPFDHGSNTVGYIPRVRRRARGFLRVLSERRKTNTQGQFSFQPLEHLERYPLGIMHLTFKILFEGNSQWRVLYTLALEPLLAVLKSLYNFMVRNIAL